VSGNAHAAGGEVKVPWDGIQEWL